MGEALSSRLFASELLESVGEMFPRYCIWFFKIRFLHTCKIYDCFIYFHEMSYKLNWALLGIFTEQVLRIY